MACNTFSTRYNIAKRQFQVKYDPKQTLKKFEILTEIHSFTPLKKIQDGGW